MSVSDVSQEVPPPVEEEEEEEVALPEVAFVDSLPLFPLLLLELLPL